MTNYADVSTIGQEALEDVTSSKAAVIAIETNMAGYSTRTEAQVMLDVNYANVVDIMELLQDDKYKTFLIKGEVE